MWKRIPVGVVVGGLLVALATVSGAEIITRGPDGTIGVAAGASASPDAAQPLVPAGPAQPARPAPVSGGVSGNNADDLERNLGDIAPGLNAEDRRDLRRDIDEALDDLDIDFDELDADLEEQADILRDINNEDGAEGSKELAAAEARFDSLTGELRDLNARLSDIGRRARAALRDNSSGAELEALIGDVRALGAAFDSFDLKIDELAVLVDAAEDLVRDRDRSRR